MTLRPFDWFRVRARVTAQGLLVAALCVMGPPALALRVVPETLTVSPGEVFLTRSITVRAVLEDDHAAGADGMEILVRPDPPQAVRLIGGSPPVPFTCSPVGGRTAGSWVYEAAAPGRVRFRLVASMLQCSVGVGENIEALTDWVTVKPLPLWSELVVDPDTPAPGGIVAVTLSVRNDAPVEAVCTPPAATEDYRGRNEPRMEEAGKMAVDPPDAVRTVTAADGSRSTRAILSPGRKVSFTWKFRALAEGEARFQVIGAGLVVMSPPVLIRPAAGLWLELSPPPPTGVGRDVTVRARVHLAGGTPVRAPWAVLTWSPTGAARLLGGGCSSTELLNPDHDAVAATFTLEALAPGPLALTLSAGGREHDTGRALWASPVTGVLRVQPPSVLTMELATPAATVLVGSRTPFTLRVVNGTSAATQGLSPIVALRRGEATLLPLSPLFQPAPARGAATFTGALVPDGEGAIELTAKATTRDDRGGPWVTAAAPPLHLLAVPPPRLEVFSLNERVAGGVTASVHFLLRNASPFAFALRGGTVTLAGSIDKNTGEAKLKPLKLDLAPGASATMTVTAWLPADKKPWWLTGLLAFSGTITAWRLPCTVQVGNRPLALVANRARGIVWSEPEGVFRPPLDPLLAVEWSLTLPGVAGLAVTAPDGRPVATLVEPRAWPAGSRVATWSGLTSQGAPVPPGAYQLRLAGPASGTALWPAGARWSDAVPFEVRKP